ncbi:NAD-dependent deacylase [Flammeovirga sp. EKP202]|uniref:SIR2 family NAD-dependent protein deacylase n=1 Tax=Flammeovirga sp. EKP202 TaxID=2770592 RepID=UPI00165EF99C|nr:NAD-dependent deacylase [Flammeovirga sp. EKP202]MBD0402151.1 NAD-dependent deacylase [Flammeovirga sp. EKP202]
MKRKKITVLTGAGISAESGIATFRGSDGLWEGHDIMEVASPQGWSRNRELVLHFYNERRKAAKKAEPNKGHLLLAELEKDYDVTVITQNVDNLHERAGSSKIIHLHGQLFQSRSTLDESLVYEMEHDEIKLGDKCEKGSQLRPNIVWFGEDVPLMEAAVEITEQSDIFIVVGTSLQVYPAANLIHYTPAHCKSYLIDPKIPANADLRNIHLIEKGGSEGLEILKGLLTKN